jgi:Mpv17 / PMP22 family
MVARAQVALLYPTRLWRGYNRALKSSPVMTKSVTCMAAYALGDAIAQFATCKAPTVEKRIMSMDVFRTARLALFGLLWSGPTGHAFYRWLDKVRVDCKVCSCVSLPPLVQRKAYKARCAAWARPSPPVIRILADLTARVQAFLSMSCGGILSIAGKVGIDQLCYSPLCTTAFFAWVNAACFTPEKIPMDISQKLLSSTQASWSLWTPCMLINMALVPAQLRMLFINVISLFWTYKLSTMSAVKAPCDPEILELASQPPQEIPAAAVACVADILADVSRDDYAVCCLNRCCILLCLGALFSQYLVLADWEMLVFCTVHCICGAQPSGGCTG